MRKLAVSLAAVAVLLMGAVTASATQLLAGNVATTDGNTGGNPSTGAFWDESSCPGSGTLCEVTFYTGVGGGSGSLTNTTSATEPMEINYQPATAAEGEVWTFTTATNASGDCNSGPCTLTFTVTGPVTITLDTNKFLNISADGVWTEAGFDPTPGDFTATLNDTTGSRGQTGAASGGESFDITPTPPVPEPSSLVLLGTGMLGAAFLLFRRNRIARAGSIA